MDFSFTSPETNEVAQVQTQVHELLVQSHLPPQVVCTAVIYELVSQIAKAAPTVEAAAELLQIWVSVGIDQLHRHGVGKFHP